VRRDSGDVQLSRRVPLRGLLAHAAILRYPASMQSLLSVQVRLQLQARTADETHFYAACHRGSFFAFLAYLVASVTGCLLEG
jgi:hypothetical protein